TEWTCRQASASAPACTGRYLHSTGRCYGLELKAPADAGFRLGLFRLGVILVGSSHSPRVVACPLRSDRVRSSAPYRREVAQPDSCAAANDVHGLQAPAKGAQSSACTRLVTSSEATKKKGCADVVTSQFS